MDRGRLPEQIALILTPKGSSELAFEQVRRTIAEPIVRVPRLRRRLVRLRFGLGAPIRVDDPGFVIDDHVDTVRCRDPGDESALRETAATPDDVPNAVGIAVVASGVDDRAGG